MARPRKLRRVCVLPEVNKFGPLCGADISEEVINMSVEEYETIRLMDLERLTQQESAEIMGIARSTLQRTYNDARTKLADSLINGKELKIKGGDYKLCSESDDVGECRNRVCGRNRHGRRNR